jgi:hypothetical protein
MQASIPHFRDVVQRIEENSWWKATVGHAKSPLKGFTFSFAGDKVAITEVPAEPFDSLLLNVRKLTMKKGPEHLLKVKNELRAKAPAAHKGPNILDVWQKYWRVAFVYPQMGYLVGSINEFLTPWRVYDCFINGQIFHSNDPTYNGILHGTASPTELSQPNLFLQNMFHSAVTNLCLAAIGLAWYIDSMAAGGDMVVHGHPFTSMEYIFWRNRTDDLDEMYKSADEEIRKAGNPPNCRWD